jgi:hypothetical protein
MTSVAYNHMSVEYMCSEKMANISTKERVFPMILVQVPLLYSRLCPIIAELALAALLAAVCI